MSVGLISSCTFGSVADLLLATGRGKLAWEADGKWTDMAGVAGVDEAAPPEGGGGIRSVLTMGSLVSPSGNEVLSQFISSCSCVLVLAASVLSLAPASVFLVTDEIWPSSKVQHSCFQ